jgi:hypothetical protein
MPSTTFAYPQVVSRTFASSIPAFPQVSAIFWSGFDSRQLHYEEQARAASTWPVSFPINIAG